MSFQRGDLLAQGGGPTAAGDAGAIEISVPGLSGSFDRQVFDLDYGEIAAALEKSEPAVRQLVSRARAHLERARPRYTPDQEAHTRLLMGFLVAAQSGDVAGMTALLAEDVRTWNDSGGKARAARKLVQGSDAVARLFIGLARKNAEAGFRPEIGRINGAPGLLIWVGEELQSATTIETDGTLIHAIHVVVNPDKLSRLAKELVQARGSGYAH